MCVRALVFQIIWLVVVPRPLRSPWKWITPQSDHVELHANLHCAEASAGQQAPTNASNSPIGRKSPWLKCLGFQEHICVCLAPIPSATSRPRQHHSLMRCVASSSDMCGPSARFLLHRMPSSTWSFHVTVMAYKRPSLYDGANVKCGPHGVPRGLRSDAAFLCAGARRAGACAGGGGGDGGCGAGAACGV